MMKTNYLKDKIEKKGALGTWCIIDSPTVVDIISSTGIDFVIIDLEHGPISYETAQQMVTVCEGGKVSPIIRLGKIDEVSILRSLDIGVHGLQMANITTAKDAEEFVKFAKYPPIGVRGFSPYTKAGLYDVKNGKKITEKANRDVLLIVNVEGVEGIKNLDKIAEVDHIDIIFIGLFDLSKSIGIPGDVENAKVIEELKKAVKIVKSKGKKIGSIASNKKMLKQFIEMKLDYITYSVDSGMIKEAYTEIINNFNSG